MSAIPNKSMRLPCIHCLDRCSDCFLKMKIKRTYKGLITLRKTWFIYRALSCDTSCWSCLFMENVSVTLKEFPLHHVQHRAGMFCLYVWSNFLLYHLNRLSLLRLANIVFLTLYVDFVCVLSVFATFRYFLTICSWPLGLNLIATTCINARQSHSDIIKHCWAKFWLQSKLSLNFEPWDNNSKRTLHYFIQQLGRNDFLWSDHWKVKELIFERLHWTAVRQVVLPAFALSFTAGI